MKYGNKGALKIEDAVSLIIPVLNEEKTVKTIIERCSKQRVVQQLIIINDGSTDNTKTILNAISKKISTKPLITVLHHKYNMGKGAAIITGLTKVLGKYVMVQDADLEYSPDDIKNLFYKAEELGNGIVFGTRSHYKKKGYLLAQLGNWYLNVMFNSLFGYNFTDSYTCYKLLPRKIWQKMNLKSNGFEIDSELIAKLGKGRYQITEVPILYFPRKYSEGKKIKWIDLLKATWVALSIRFSKSTNYRYA